MARGSIGRERMISGVVGGITTSHQSPAHQEDLNNELLAVSLESSIIHNALKRFNHFDI